jgi:hypothetical protein
MRWGFCVQGLGHRDQMGECSGVDGAAARLRGWAAEGDHPGHVDDRAFASDKHARKGGAGEHRRGDDLDMNKFPGFVGGQVHQRHVVSDTRVVDEHRQWLRRAQLSDRVHAVIGGQVGGQ